MLENRGEGGLKFGQLEMVQYEPLLGLLFDTQEEADKFIKDKIHLEYGISTKVLKDENGKFVIWYSA